MQVNLNSPIGNYSASAVNSKDSDKEIEQETQSLDKEIQQLEQKKRDLSKQISEINADYAPPKPKDEMIRPLDKQIKQLDSQIQQKQAEKSKKQNKNNQAAATQNSNQQIHSSKGTSSDNNLKLIENFNASNNAAPFLDSTKSEKILNANGEIPGNNGNDLFNEEKDVAGIARLTDTIHNPSSASSKVDLFR